jgi:opacity protein-like surface antigen
MGLKILLSATVAIGLLTAAIPIFSQVVPQAKETGLPFTLGAGVSSFDVDWGHGRMLGGTLWADWRPGRIPSFLNGFGLEVEARDISLNHSSSQPPNYREDTAGGGPIYTWRRYRNFRPYGKYLIQFGSMDFRASDPTYSHDTRTVSAPGVGLEFRLFRNVWARADYEYQFWPDLLGGTADPQGFTFGASYDFGYSYRR